MADPSYECANIGREPQNNMTKDMGKGKYEELEPSLQFTLLP